MIKVLDETYINQMVEISMIKSRVGGIANHVQGDELLQYRYTQFKPFFHGPDKFKTFGYFDNDKLVSFMTLGFFEHQSRGKFYVVAFFATKKFSNIFTFTNNEYGLLLSECMKYAESEGYYKYFYSIGERIFNVYQTKFAKNPFIDHSLYERTTVAEIPANTQPKSELYWRLMNERLIDCKVYIRQLVKKIN